MTAGPDPAADTAAPAPRLVLELAAETLRVLAWILTPEDGYEPPDNPIPQLLRKVACRLIESHPARGTVRCEQAAEVAPRQGNSSSPSGRPPGPARPVRSRGWRASRARRCPTRCSPPPACASRPPN
jgi:hypothetical protein